MNQNLAYKVQTEYDYWMCSFAVALSDLKRLNKILMRLSESKDAEDSFFYFKIAIGYLLEAYDLIREAFTEENIKDYVLGDEEVNRLWDEI